MNVAVTSILARDRTLDSSGRNLPQEMPPQQDFQQCQHDGTALLSIAGATYGVYSDKDCTKQLATLTDHDNSGNTDTVEVKAGTVYIKELSAPVGYKVDSTVYSLNVEAGKTVTLNVSDTPKVTDTLIELFKIDMETYRKTLHRATLP